MILVFFKRPRLEKKIFYTIVLFFFTLTYFIYTIQIDKVEFLIRTFQIFNLAVIYIYSRKNFFLLSNEFNPIKVLFICQFPSLAVGFLEICYLFSDNLILENFILDIRLITANISDRATLFKSNNILLHFFEGSLASYYFITLAAIFLLFYSEKNNIFKNKNIVFIFSVCLFLICLIFHRSTTFILLLAFFSLFYFLKTRNIIFLLTVISVFILIILTNSIIFKKFLIYNSGHFVESDLFRFTSIISSITTFINTYGLGSGPGTFTSTFYLAIFEFFNIFNFGQFFEDAVLNNYNVSLYKDGNRAPMNAPYFVLIGEYGIFFIIFVILFHGDAFKFKYLEDVVELTLLVGLFVGYPLAFPYFWFLLGLLHNNRIKKNKYLVLSERNEKKYFNT